MAEVTPSLHEEVLKQYREESRGVRHDHDLMLRMKYGLATPVLTGAENNIIKREERNAGSRR